MNKLTLISLLLSALLFGCNSESSKSSGSVKAKTLTESEKLAYRKSKWGMDLKCLKAVEISSDRVDALCAKSSNIYNFANEGSLEYAFAIVDSQLEILNTYQKELDEGLRGTIPEDELDISNIELSLILDRKEKTVEVNNEKYDRISLCLDRATLGDVNYDFCKMDVENDFQTREQNINNKFNEIEIAIDNFKTNYVALP